MINKHIESNNKWYVLGLAAMTMTFCMSMPNICMPVLFNEISIDLGLSLVQVGWIWGLSMAAGILTVFLSGILVDHFGVKRILVFACLMIGLAGASRGLAKDFTSLLFTTFLFGIFISLITGNIFKVAAVWFPSNQLGLASGVLTTGMGIGFTAGSMISATLLSPLLGGWRGVLFLYGAISLFISLLWNVTVKKQHPTTVTDAGSSIISKEAIYQVLRNKNVWLISLTMLGYIACIDGMCGYLPLYLREFKEWVPATADSTLAVFTGVSTLGAIPISLLSDRIGRRKIFMIPIITIAIIGVGLLSVADGIIIFIILIIVGVGRDSLMALATVSAIESRGIGVLYSGTAMGLIQTILRIGILISPPIGNSMAARSTELPFIVWAFFGVFSLVCFSLTMETGHNKACII